MGDIENRVVAIQGVSVSSTDPTDGYVLKYNGATEKWTPSPLPESFGNCQYFTESGTFTVPEGVTRLMLIGCGGGGGGSDATDTTTPSNGGSALSNTGSGGGGSGGTSYPFITVQGGTGGSGYLYVIW